LKVLCHFGGRSPKFARKRGCEFHWRPAGSNRGKRIELVPPTPRKMTKTPAIKLPASARRPFVVR
jgi:hypothetical protein